MNLKIPIEFITPCFCRGADSSETGAPEIRPASIRGQLHWWFRAVGGTPQEEKDIFGSVRGGAKASRIVVRVKHGNNLKIAPSPTLPHKPPKEKAPKQAIAPGAVFELLISTRLGGLSPDLEKKFRRALDAWLHFGALGLRATRGGGNFTWDAAPKTPDDYDAAIKEIIAGTSLCAALLSKSYQKAEDARYDITNTLGDKTFGNAAPLGRALGGRKTSPLRFRVVRFADGSFRIAAIWDGRQNVTGNTRKDLSDAIQKLKENGKSIGEQLAASSLA